MKASQCVRRLLASAIVLPGLFACSSDETSGEGSAEDSITTSTGRPGAGPTVRDFKITLLDDMIVSRRTEKVFRRRGRSDTPSPFKLVLGVRTCCVLYCIGMEVRAPQAAAIVKPSRQHSSGVHR